MAEEYLGLQKIIGADLLAQPPMQAAANITANTWFIYIWTLLCLVFIARVWLLKKNEAKLVTAMFIGGATCSVIEPGLDILTGCFHPIVGQDTIYTLGGRGMPTWILPGYALFYGGNMALLIEAFNKGITRRSLWMFVLISPIFNYAMEYMMLEANLYYYYGNQPLVFIKLPLYQLALNSCGMLIGLTVLYFLQPVLQKWWQLILASVVLIPYCGFMGYMATGLPGFYAAHSTWPNWAVQLSGLACFPLYLMVAYAVTQLVCVDSLLYDKLRKSGLRPVREDR